MQTLPHPVGWTFNDVVGKDGAAKGRPDIERKGFEQARAGLEHEQLLPEIQGIAESAHKRQGGNIQQPSGKTRGKLRVADYGKANAKRQHRLGQGHVDPGVMKADKVGP